MNKILEIWQNLKGNFRCLCYLVISTAPCQQFNLISISAQKLKLFLNYLFKSLVTNYMNGIRLIQLFSVYYLMYVKLAIFLNHFSRKVPFSDFPGANHQKHLNFLILSGICIVVIIVEIKKQIAISGDPAKNQYHTPYSYGNTTYRSYFHIFYIFLWSTFTKQRHEFKINIFLVTKELLLLELLIFDETMSDSHITTPVLFTNVTCSLKKKNRYSDFQI